MAERLLHEKYDSFMTHKKKENENRLYLVTIVPTALRALKGFNDAKVNILLRGG